MIRGRSKRETARRPAPTAGEHDRCAHTHTHTQSYNHMITVFHLTTTPVDCSTLRWLQAAILNLFSGRTRLSYFFYYMTAGIFHFHTEIESKRLTSVFLALLTLVTTLILCHPPISSHRWDPRFLTHCSGMTEAPQYGGLGRDDLLTPQSSNLLICDQPTNSYWHLLKKRLKQPLGQCRNPFPLFLPRVLCSSDSCTADWRKEVHA